MIFHSFHDFLKFVYNNNRQSTGQTLPSMECLFTKQSIDQPNQPIALIFTFNICEDASTVHFRHDKSEYPGLHVKQQVAHLHR